MPALELFTDTIFVNTQNFWLMLSIFSDKYRDSVEGGPRLKMPRATLPPLPPPSPLPIPPYSLIFSNGFSRVQVATGKIPPTR